MRRTARQALARAVAVVAFKDAQPFRQSVFDYLAGHSRTVQLSRGLYRRLPLPASTVMVGGYGILSFLAVRLPGEGRVVAVGAYRNEHRQFDELERILGERIGRVDLASAGALSPASWAALVRVLRRHGPLLRAAVEELGAADRAHRDFLVGARVAATTGHFLRFWDAWEQQPPAVVLVSSDSNPYAMGATEAAHARGIPTVYITHGHIPDGPPELDVDLSIVDGPAVLRVYDESQGRRGAAVFKGAEGAHRPLQTAGLRSGEPLTVGLFGSLIVDWDVLRDTLDRLVATLRPARLLLRLHPNQTIRDPRALERLGLDRPALAGVVEVSDGATVLTDDAARCDLVVVGESSAHLTLLKFGVPTVHVPGLDLVPRDFYRFLVERMVCAFDTVEAVDPLVVADFYEDPDWPRRFRGFDASYGRGSLDEEVRAALLALVEGP